MIRAMVSAAALILFLALAFDASGHSAGADAYVADDGKIIVEAWMGQGEVPNEGKVTVLLPDGSIYKTGELAEGKWSFMPDRAISFSFMVDLGHGHGKKFSLHPDEMAKLEEVLDKGMNQAADSGLDLKSPEHNSSPAVRKHPGEGSDFYLKVIVGLLVIGQLMMLGWVRRLSNEIASLKAEQQKHERE